MKIVLLSIILVLISTLLPITVKSELIWEKEIQSLGVFIDSVKYEVYPDTKLYRCGDKFFTFYFGYLQDTDQDTVNKYFRYPALISFDKNGVILFQKEEYQFEIEYNAKKYNGIDRYSRACMCSGDTLKVDIPQVAAQNKSPNIYNFNTVNGNLIRIDGVSKLSQWNQLSKAVFSVNELLALGAWSPYIGLSDLKQNRIDVYDHYGKMNYRINLKNESFLNRIQSASGDFIYTGNNSFITTYSAKNDTAFIAKYKYDTLEIANVVSGASFPGELEWLSEFQPVGPQNYIISFKEMDNGDIISSTNNSVVIKVNKFGEVLFNKFLVNNTDENINYMVNNIIKLKKSGYTAHYGYIKDNKRRKFGIIIADENLNVVEEIKWQYDDKDTTTVLNNVEDVIEDDDGNLIVLGINHYLLGNNKSIEKPYLAAIRPNYLTSVKDESDNNNGIVIYPNPVNDFITIQFQTTEVSKVQIFDMLGIEIMSESIHSITDSHRMNVSHLPVGVYFIRIGTRVEKFVKMQP